MANILGIDEAARVLRVEEHDELMLDTLNVVDAYIEQATGRDWAADSTIEPLAKSAARILLVRLYEDPGQMATAAMGPALQAALSQLEARALALETAGVADDALALAATNILGEMDVTASLVLVFNHAMAASATAAVTLLQGSTAVTTVNSLDATGKILTINPSASLTAGSAYSIVINHAADQYGQTLDTELSFWTA